MTKSRYRILIRTIAAALVLGSILINIKNIFTSCQVDAEYQVAMAYRILRGDAMFSEMWEAHQTSAFFLAFFEWLFLKITGTTTGIMVYANTVGFFCKLAVSFLVYGTLRRYVDKRAAFAALIFALNAYPKDIMLPDFSNLQIWFALLLMCCLITYFEGGGKLRWLVLGAVFLCLEVLSYPSCALVWLSCVILIALYSAKKKRDILVFTGICGASGAAYLLYFMHGNPKQFMSYIYAIWSGDESHAVSIGERFSLIGRDFIALAADMKYIACVAVLACAAALICRIVCERHGRKMAQRRFFHLSISWFVGLYVLTYLIHLPAEAAGTKHHFFILYIFVEAVALIGMRYLDAAEKRVFVTGQLIGLGGFLATLFLSDLGLFPTLPYLIPNLCVSMQPLVRLGRREEKDGKAAVMLADFAPVIWLCAVLIFRNFIYINGWMYVPASFYEDSIFSVNWTAQYGPLKGIVNREGTYVADVTYLECQEVLKPGDKVLVLSYPSLAATIYLNQEVEICADSTISTPTYSERLLQYWEENPDKYPNVVIVKCFESNIMIGENSPVTEWLTEEFEADSVVDGVFWRYYRKE